MIVSCSLWKLKVPEYIELKLNAEVINKSSEVVYSRVINYNSKGGGDIVAPAMNFKVKAFARGKELMLSLYDDIPSMYYKFHLGMSGMFYLSPVPPDYLGPTYEKNTLFAFESQNKQSYLCFLDVRRFAKWKFTSAWGNDRGPDPLIEEGDFRAKVAAAIHSKDFKKPIYEVLTNQNYFNGIGNILRADLLAQVDDTPFQSAEDWFNKHPDFCDTIVNHLKVTEERNSSQGEDGQYGRGQYIIDKKNRKFWYNEKWAVNI